MTQRWQLHPDLAVLPGPPPRLWDHRRARLQRLDPPELAAVLTAFVRPTTEAHGRGSGGDAPGRSAFTPAAGAAPAAAVTPEAIERCRRAGLLVPAPTPTPIGDTLFGAPARSLAEVLVDPPDLVAVGVPYDAGATGRAGSRDGPAGLRRASGTCFTYTEAEGRPRGSWDPRSDGRILAGTRMADVGDLGELAPTRNGNLFDRLRQTVTHLAGRGCLPVVLGGDHSIGLAVLAGQVRAHGRIGVLHVDAHADRGHDPGGGWRHHVHHGNYLTWALRDQRIAQVVQLGVRQRQPEPPPDDARVCIWPGTTAAEVAPEVLLGTLDPELPWHLSFDVDALDPTVLPATGTPVPGGFTTTELAGALTGVVRERRLIGVDVCELLPGDDPLAGLAPCEVLVQVLAATYR